MKVIKHSRRTRSLSGGNYESYLGQSYADTPYALLFPCNFIATSFSLDPFEVYLNYYGTFDFINRWDHQYF